MACIGNSPAGRLVNAHVTGHADAEARRSEGRGGLVELRTSLPLLSLANQWAHIVATYDGTHTALYLNG
ncbi:hypothetical protein T484DRAFT_1772504 [Baffinella frigidus]|nr:hypothetical protein T484DRAFT_1772504 [Cryptophyta sp. CCMP2293]